MKGCLSFFNNYKSMYLVFENVALVVGFAKQDIIFRF